MSKKTNKKLEKYFHLVTLLKQACKGKCKEKFKNIISYLDEKSLLFLCECIRNVLSPDFVHSLPSAKKKKLLKHITPYKKPATLVIKKNISFKKRKKHLQEGGAWFMPLIPIVFSLISSLLGNQQKND